jgi:hypothetical protein
LSLHIITSRKLLGTHLATNEALLCTCKKESSVPARHGSVHTQYRSLIETISMRLALHGQRPTSDTLRFNGVYPCLA